MKHTAWDDIEEWGNDGVRAISHGYGRVEPEIVTSKRLHSQTEINSR